MKADDTPVTEFDGEVTVTLPYTLEYGEDPENIAIWYIDVWGEPHSIQAAYYFDEEENQGYVTFKTTHFSKYTVTRLTPAQRCALYNHSFKDTVVETSCTVDGFKLSVCQRCGHTEREELGKATGHSMISDPNKTDKAATCTEDGYSYLVCKHGCGRTQTVKIPAVGHDWEEQEGAVAATCKNAGNATYNCNNCGESYTAITVQLQHRYKAVVTAATCTAGGYTTYTCEYCQNKYTGNYISATGHNYAVTVIAPTCTEDGYNLHKCTECDNEYKTDTVAAAHNWDISSPTCGRGQKCLVCGTNGAAATGNHSMTDGVCTVCGKGCDHTNTVTVYRPSCTENGYTLRHCTKCGRDEKYDIKPALGHEGVLSCSRCHKMLVGEDFFVNGITSVLNKDFAIRASGVSVNVADMAYVLDFAELFITYDQDGNIYGYASGTLNANDSFIPELMSAKAQAVIKDGYIYVKTEIPVSFGMGGDSSEYEYYDTMSSTVCLVIPFEKLNMEEIGSTEASFRLIPVIYEAFHTEIKPLLDTLIVVNGSEVTTVAQLLAEKLCTVEKSGAGYTFILDFDVLKTLNDNLYSHTISETIDLLLGEGLFAEVRAAASTLMQSTVGKLVMDGLQKGLSVAEIIDIADQVCVLVTGMDFEELTGKTLNSFKDLIENEALLTMTVIELANRYWDFANYGNITSIIPDGNDDFSEEDYYFTVEEILGYIDEFGGYNAYELICQTSGLEMSELKGIVDSILDPVSKTSDIKIYTDAYGNVTGGEISAESTMLDIDGTVIDFGGSLIITDKVSTNVNYNEVEEEVKEIAEKFEFNVGAIKCNYPEAKVTTYSDGSVKSATVTRNEERVVNEWTEYDSRLETDEDGKEYEVVIEIINREIEYVYENIVYEFDKEPVLMLTADCGSWYNVNVMPSKKQITRRVEFVTLRIVDDVIEDEQRELKEEYSNTQYDGEGITFDFNTVTKRAVASNQSFGSFGRHNFIEDDNKREDCGDGCYDWGEMHFYCTDCGKTKTQYFAHGHERAVRFEPLTGNKVNDCEDGYYYINYCKNCGEELYRYVADYHDVWANAQTVDLAEYGACADHEFRMMACACGKESHFENNGRLHYLGMEQTGPDSYTESYACERCALTMTINSTHTQNTNVCEETLVRVYVIKYNGNTVGDYTVTEKQERHKWRNLLELAQGSKTCEDGVIVTQVCINCGQKSDRNYLEHGHVTGCVQIIDLEQYGAECGEKLLVYGCACGMYYESYEIISNGATDLGIIEESSYNNTRYDVKEPDGSLRTVYDELTVSHCAVTNPVQCNLIIADKKYMSQSGCEGYLDILIGCDRNGKNAQKVITLLIYTKHCHNDVTTEDLGACKYNEVHKCVRCEDSYVTTGIKHTVGDSIEFISGCRYGYHCSVCGQYVDTEYRHDLQWKEVGTCKEEYTCSKCGYVADVRYTHNFEWKRAEGCLWNSACSKCGQFNESEYRHDFEITEATCTQFGNKHCKACGVDLVILPHNHNWVEDENGFRCTNCNITGVNGVSGDVVLEDCSEELGGDENYVVGFWIDYYDKQNQYRYDKEFVLSVTLILNEPQEDGNDQILAEGIEVKFNSHGGGNYVEFSKSAVGEWASENGFEAGSYEVRLSFVPVGWQCDLDYGITF